MHLNTAGARSHDKIHDGLGVVTQHIAITQAFELSLQSIAPHISVPYWDYTYDSAHSKTEFEGQDKTVFHHDLFADSWFGSTSKDRSHAITNGRFAYQMVSMYNSSSGDLHSPFGYLRAPWNVNPSPYVTRYHKLCGIGPEETYVDSSSMKELTDYQWPTCASHYKLTFSYDSWYDWV